MPECHCTAYLLIARVGEFPDNKHTMSAYKNQYRLDVQIEGQAPMKVDVIDSITVGLDPRCDLVLSGSKIKTKHMVFELKEENLALIYLGNTNQTFLNNLPLEEGKTYLLDAGDRLYVSGLEIILLLEPVLVHESQKVKTKIFKAPAEMSVFTPPPAVPSVPTPPRSIERQIKSSPERAQKKIPTGSFLSLLLVKLYSLVADFFFTYLVLIVVIPLVRFQQPVLSVFNYLASLATIINPNFKMHSFIPFLIVWYLLSLAQTLLFGTTLGQFLLGLKIKSENKFGKLFLYRLKTFIYSLFLIPAQNNVSEKLFFKAIRKAGMPIIFLFIIISPFLLSHPYNPSMAIALENQTPHKELRTRSLYSESKLLGVKLSAELSPRYYVLPYVDTVKKSSRAFHFFDLKNSQNVIVQEVRSISFDEIEEQLMYANPLFDSLRSKKIESFSLREKKELIQKILSTSPASVKEALLTFGPFYGSAVLLKTYLTSPETTDMTVNFYRPETPVISISTNAGSFFYLFSRDSLKVYSAHEQGEKALLPAFEEQVFSKFLSEEDESVILNKQNVSILSAQDAFLQGDEQTFLTYYVGIANTLPKVPATSKDDEFTEKARLAFISNVESVEKAVTNRNVLQSFNDIKYQLTPMEKPGVKR